MDGVPLVNHARPEVALHDRLRRHQVPEPALHFRVGCPKELVKAFCLHVIDIGPECQGGNIARYVVPADYLAVNRLNLGFPPVKLRYLLYPRQLPPDKADHTAVMHTGSHAPCLIIADRVIRRQAKIRIARIRYKLPFRVNAVPAVEDLHAEEATGHYRIQVQGLA